MSVTKNPINCKNTNEMIHKNKKRFTFVSNLDCEAEEKVNCPIAKNAETINTPMTETNKIIF